MTSWEAFEKAAPELGEAGRRLFVGADGVAIGYLATVSAASVPRISPVCPIFCGEHVYLSAAARTPKARDLRAKPAFALHAFPGANDEEFRITGRAAEVSDADERAAVHAAIPFPAFDVQDPVFRLTIDRALWVFWERVGQPDTRPIRRRWPANRGGPVA